MPMLFRNAFSVLLFLSLLAAPAYAQVAQENPNGVPDNLVPLPAHPTLKEDVKQPAKQPQVQPGVAPEAAKEEAPAPYFKPDVAPEVKTEVPKPASPPPLKSTGNEIDISASKSLEWNENDRIYTATGNAKAVKGEMTVEADVLKAFDRKKPDGSSEVWKMEADGNVKLSGKGGTAHGDHAVYDIDTRKAVLTGKNLELDTKQDKVTATQSLEYWENEKQALAVGNAVAIRDGRETHADKLVAHMSANKNGDQDISRIEAVGHVHIVGKDDVIFCDMLAYDVANDAATLTGNVSITRGKSQLRGDKVEANFKTGKSRIVNSGSGRVRALISASPGQKGSSQKGGTTGLLMR